MMSLLRSPSQAAHSDSTAALKAIWQLVLVNRCRDEIRARKRQPLSLDEDTPIQSDFDPPDRRMISDEQSRQIADAMAQLPYEQTGSNCPTSECGNETQTHCRTAERLRQHNQGKIPVWPAETAVGFERETVNETSRQNRKRC